MSEQLEVKRVVFKQLAEGDFRKFEAQSNDATTGGGARDLRFSPYDRFQRIFRLLFPTVRQELRRRDGHKEPVEVLVGHFHWSDGATGGAKEATFEPPTTARPNEGRIPVVHTYPPFNHPPPTNQGRILLLLIQRSDDSVWPAFVTEDALRAGALPDSLRHPVLQSLDAKRAANQLARGYIDLVTGEQYSDA